MDQKEYIENLKLHLKGFSKKESDEIISEIMEHFRSGMELGNSEEEISAMLGKPSDLILAYLEENPPASSEKIKKSLRSIRKPVIGITLLILIISGIFFGSAFYSMLNIEIYGGGDSKPSVNLYSLFNCTQGQGYLIQDDMTIAEKKNPAVYLAILKFLKDNPDSEYCGLIKKPGFFAGLINSDETIHLIFSRMNSTEIIDLKPVLLGETEEIYESSIFPENTGQIKPSLGMKLFRLKIPVNENLTEYMTIDFCDLWRDSYILAGDKYIYSHNAGRFYVNHLDGQGLSVDYYEMGKFIPRSYYKTKDGINNEKMITFTSVSGFTLNDSDINDGIPSDRISEIHVWKTGGIPFCVYSGIMTSIMVDPGMNVTSDFKSVKNINFCMNYDNYNDYQPFVDVSELLEKCMA
ncbi:DUF1700 domain-containing protein [Methanoplanus sp. FWC-SCC4]|uniref:DUF1700 domain-containing protein n=1 Tax=Methanochimaera problematica TaxID=2609417 RepID=A0AA97FCE9_9EURY|nr:DUF1700 domain-containing protein [Methanoplanus sp. FWC-SCC4]WOF15663.1 DUF1700 domain-containing protein [Methanoplanus sp. FWC-SCC4]